jgi:hypothetical protein
MGTNRSPDSLSQFLYQAALKSHETIDAFHSQYSRLVDIDAAFVRIQENLDDSDEWFAALMFLRTHASYRATVRLAVSGQLPETYAILRATIENALYGLYLSRNKSSVDTWLQRNDSPRFKQLVRSEFTIASLMRLLKTLDQRTHGIAEHLYDLAIDMGAHPNQFSLTGNLRIEASVNKTLLKVAYLSGDALGIQVSLKTAAQLGVCCLSIFRHVFEKRFELLGITQLLGKLERGL